MSSEDTEIPDKVSPKQQDSESIPHLETVARTVSGLVAAGTLAAIFGGPAIFPVVAALLGSFAGYYAKRLDSPSASDLAKEIEFTGKPASHKKQAREQATQVINRWAISAAAVSWVPGSPYVVTAGDLQMLTQVAAIYGVDLDKTTARTIFATVAAPLIGRTLAQLSLEFVPVLGMAANAYGIGKAVGKATIEYFEGCTDLPDEL